MDPIKYFRHDIATKNIPRQRQEVNWKIYYTANKIKYASRCIKMETCQEIFWNISVGVLLEGYMASTEPAYLYFSSKMWIQSVAGGSECIQN